MGRYKVTASDYQHWLREKLPSNEKVIKRQPTSWNDPGNPSNNKNYIIVDTAEKTADDIAAEKESVVEGEEKPELSSLKKGDLQQMCDEKGIDYKNADTKAALIVKLT